MTGSTETGFLAQYQIWSISFLQKAFFFECSPPGEYYMLAQDSTTTACALDAPYQIRLSDRLIV
ncbi:hypothetical protein [Microcoleus sp. bin38.metabat.b11b12b14.051]|uniref:hypothetical protein n=1 Tax=Microcoleus sp. bin38.metabat.b11b12b14.051 TaxID=2742709 RepID=UPI0025E0DF97|nr:hypothetical protein [Microcoleus sp. bin38.metabat.b11b12b14.051]